MPRLQQRPPPLKREGAPRIHVRPATADDSTFLAQIILRAGRAHLAKGYWDIVVDDDGYDRLDLIEMLTVLESRSWCHFSGFQIATVNGAPAGACAGYDPLAAGFLEPGLALAAGFDFLEWSDQQVNAAYSRVAPMAASMPKFSHGVWVVEWLGVMPAFRRMGVAGRLLAAALHTGHAAGHRRAETACYLENEPAMAVYRRGGFGVTEELRHPDFERATGAPGMVLLARDI